MNPNLYMAVIYALVAINLMLQGLGMALGRPEFNMSGLVVAGVALAWAVIVGPMLR